MPRKKLERKNEFIQIVISPDDKAAFDAYCSGNSMTMSDRIREKIAPDILKGKKLLKERSNQE